MPIGSIFSKSKTNMDEDKKENFRIEIVKTKVWIFTVIQYAVLKFSYHWCFAHAQLKLLNRALASL